MKTETETVKNGKGRPSNAAWSVITPEDWKNMKDREIQEKLKENGFETSVVNVYLRRRRMMDKGLDVVNPDSRKIVRLDFSKMKGKWHIMTDDQAVTYLGKNGVKVSKAQAKNARLSLAKQGKNVMCPRQKYTTRKEKVELNESQAENTGVSTNSPE